MIANRMPRSGMGILRLLEGAFGTLEPRMFDNFGCQKPNSCTCTLCCKQPLSLKTAASKIVFGLYNFHKFCFDHNTTCDQYVYAVRSRVNLKSEQLVPFFEFPDTLHFIQFDHFSLVQFHEHCSLAVNVQGSGSGLARYNDNLKPMPNLLIWSYIVRPNFGVHFVKNHCFYYFGDLRVRGLEFSLSGAFPIDVPGVVGYFLSAHRPIIKRVSAWKKLTRLISARKISQKCLPSKYIIKINKLTLLHSDGEIFHTRPGCSWGTSSLLYSGYRVFPTGKAVGVWR